MFRAADSPDRRGPAQSVGSARSARDWAIVVPLVTRGFAGLSASPVPRRVRVRDLPTRVFHWLLAVAVVALVITGHVGGDALQWHMRIGLLVLALLAFRIVWGLIGGRWSRFASFAYSPATIWRYLRGDHRPGDWFEVGHNPLGSLSVFALLALLVAQVGTGLIADDEIGDTGPLNRFVTDATALQATAWHKGPGQWLVISLVLLHVAAIAFYFRRGKPLLPAMLHGDKRLDSDPPAAADGAGTRLLALAVAAACGAAAVWVYQLGM
jgi:cytochrome b